MCAMSIFVRWLIKQWTAYNIWYSPSSGLMEWKIKLWAFKMVNFFVCCLFAANDDKKLNKGGQGRLPPVFYTHFILTDIWLLLLLDLCLMKSR